MPIAPFTEYEAGQLLLARKFISRALQDNLQSPGDAERHVVYDVRRRDMPNKDLRLRLYARLPASVAGIRPNALPGASLQWKGKNIRKVDYALRHDSIRYGASAGVVRGWHEHIWTDEDEGKYIIAASPNPGKCDVRSLVRWACKKWNIDADEIGEQLNLRR
jgi:hypothetical protein